MHHSSTYGNLRKERKFARQLFLGITLAIIAAIVLIYVVSQLKALYPYLPGTTPATQEEQQQQDVRPLEPTQ